MRISILGLAAGLVLAPIAALAADSTTDSQPAPQPVAVTQQDPVVCHYMVHEGTVIARPICKTQHEWERMQDYQQRLIRQFQLRTLAEHE